MALGAAASGVLFEVAYRPILKRSVSALLIVAIAASEVVENALRVTVGGGFEAYPQLLPNTGIDIAGTHLSFIQLLLVGISLALVAGLTAFFAWTVTGTAIRALACDHTAARLVGINVNALIRQAFVMLGLYYRQIHFDMGFPLALRAFTAASAPTRRRCS